MDKINDRPPLDPEDYEDIDIDDDDNPELTDADFAEARPAREVLGGAFVDAWEAARRDGTLKAAPAVTVMLPQEVADWYMAQGGHWRVRIEEDLKELVRIKSQA